MIVGITGVIEYIVVVGILIYLASKFYDNL